MESSPRLKSNGPSAHDDGLVLRHSDCATFKFVRKDNRMDTSCPICTTGVSSFFEAIDGFDYMQCTHCGSLHIASDVIAEIDGGRSTRLYDEAYWQEELRAARERAAGAGLVRAGEAILYTRREVKRFLDIGTGPGYLLDELARHFPERSDMFYGIELFPPVEHSLHPNYRVGEVGELDMMFDAGTCVEVIEHLTPRMLVRLVASLAKVSNPGSTWFFNTGMPDYVINEDRAYLDPLHRGHIVSYSPMGLAHIFEPHGFKVRTVPGKSYAFLAEFRPPDEPGDFSQRIYQPLPENRSLLEQSGLLYQAAFEAARASYYRSEYLARTQWALSLQGELGVMRALRAAPGSIKRRVLSRFLKPPRS